MRLKDILEIRVAETMNVLLSETEKGLYEYKSLLSQLLQDFKRHVIIEDYCIDGFIYDSVDDALNEVANIAYANELNADNNVVNDVFYRLFLIKQILNNCDVEEVE